MLKLVLQAFPPGDYFEVPNLPNVTAVNALGDFGIAADRLAFIDGEGKTPVLSRSPFLTYTQHQSIPGGQTPLTVSMLQNVEIAY